MSRNWLEECRSSESMRDSHEKINFDSNICSVLSSLLLLLIWEQNGDCFYRKTVVLYVQSIWMVPVGNFIAQDHTMWKRWREMDWVWLEWLNTCSRKTCLRTNVECFGKQWIKWVKFKKMCLGCRKFSCDG